MDLYDKLTDPSRFAVFDGACDKDKGGMMLDAATESAKALYQVQDLKIKAAAAVQQWTDDDIEMGEGETHSDRLFALLVGIVDVNENGEIDDDEADAFDIVANFALDYLLRHGVDEGDAAALLNDWDNDTGERVRDLLVEALPGDDEAGEDMDAFAFGEKGDAEILDAVYKKRVVIRAGKKVRINKRISGTVRRSGAQKAAMKKAQRKSHSAGAMMRRAKSVLKRVKMGIKSAFGK